jgi:ATP-dependent DNA ligase
VRILRRGGHDWTHRFFKAAAEPPASSFILEGIVKGSQRSLSRRL